MTSTAAAVRDVTLADIADLARTNPAAVELAVRTYLRDVPGLADAPPAALAELLRDASHRCERPGCGERIYPWSPRSGPYCTGRCSRADTAVLFGLPACEVAE